MNDERYTQTVAALVDALEHVGAVDPEDGCMAMFPERSRRTPDPLKVNHYWTPAKHVAELLVNHVGIEFFAETAEEEA